MGSQDPARDPCSAAPGCSQHLGSAVGWVGARERRANACSNMNTCVLAAAVAELACTASLPCKDRLHLLCGVGKMLFECEK